MQSDARAAAFDGLTGRVLLHCEAGACLTLPHELLGIGATLGALRSHGHLICHQVARVEAYPKLTNQIHVVVTERKES